MAKQHLPNVVGCAVGFSAAGCGIGSLVGTAVWPVVRPTPPVGQATANEQILTQYGGTLLGILIGLGLGAIAGAVYAVLVRRSRLRGADSDQEPRTRVSG